LKLLLLVPHFEVNYGHATGVAVKRLWPVWVSIILPLLLVALNATPIATDLAFVLICIPVLLGIWACFGIWALILSVRQMRRREWSLAVASAVLPLVIFVAGLQFWQFVHLCNDGGDVVYFMAKRSSYLEQIRTVPSDGEPRLLVFNRGGMSWSSRGYVYDDSDEIVRDERLRSANWKARADNTELTCGYYAQPLPGHLSFTQHWYLASFDC
jgi:hypothetical protein